jgi:hypothetical protein
MKKMSKQILFFVSFLLIADCMNAQHTYGSKYYGDALVTYILAQNKTEAATIVMVPGLNLTSYIFSTTPDNRKGWADMFADKGYNVYMVNDPKHDFATGGIVSPYTVPSNGKAATSGATQAWQSDIWSRWGFGTSQGNPYANAKFPTDSFAAFARNYPYVGTSSQGFDKAMHCPTAAAACFIRMLSGFSCIFSLLRPTAIAPDDTRMTSYPIFWMSASVQTRRSMARRSLFPASFVNVDVPTFTTILLLQSPMILIPPD